MFRTWRRLTAGLLGLGMALGACRALPARLDFTPTPIRLPSSTLTPHPSDTATPTVRPSPTSSGTPASTATAVPLVYVFPVQPLEAAVYKQGGHAYGAIDIFAPYGAAYVAVTSGVIDFVCREDRWDPSVDDPATRGGLMVAFIGDDGVRYYGSHLSVVVEGLAPGMRVEAGQLLGRVGNTGNARNTDPHVHFGISHPTYPEDWRTRRGEVDPYPYLQAWALGLAVTPRLPTATPTSYTLTPPNISDTLSP